VARSKSSAHIDLVKRLGPLAFASRLKRLADRLHRDVSRFYRSRSLEFESRWFPVLYVLKDHPPIAVTELAEMLGLTHPAINQIAGDMARHGLVLSERDDRDERRHLLNLTPKARRLLLKIEPVWADIRTATSDVIQESGHDLLASLDALEQRLDALDMCRRLEKMQGREKRSTACRKRVPGNHPAAPVSKGKSTKR
jgi:DNA-binding MarR family transcriptional regulator